MSRYRAHSGTCDRILLSVRRLFSEICCLVFLGRPLWREAGSVLSKSQVKVTLQLTVSQSLCQGIEPILGLVTRYYFLSEDCFLKFALVLSLWDALSDERSDLSLVSQSHITTDVQSVIMSRYRDHSGTCNQILISVRRLLSESCCLVSVGRPLWREVGSVFSKSKYVSMSRHRAHSGTCDQILLSIRRLFSEICCLVFLGCPLWRDVRSVTCLSQSSNFPLFTSNIYITYILQYSNLYTINKKLQSVPSE
jgi:hypothetical protein